MIYLDNHATTPCDPRVIESMKPYYADYFGNASSDHAYGQSAAIVVKEAEHKLKKILSGEHGDLIFTSGATESNNIALLGIAYGHMKRTGKKGKIVTTQIEHKAILGPLEFLANQGWTIEFLALKATGRVDLPAAEKLISGDTVLVTVQLANSEIGTIQPLKELAELAHKAGALFHTDASQAFGKIVFDVRNIEADLVSISAHKLYGPKGIGALWIRSEYKKYLEPIMYGGNSGDKLRPGTIPVPLVAGFGTACKICYQELESNINHTLILRDEFERLLKIKIPSLLINGDGVDRLPNNSNMTFPGVEAEMLLANLPEIIASTGSACESGSIEPSRVLLAIGLTRELAYNSLRIGIGRFNNLEEIALAVNMITAAYYELFAIVGQFN